ncbi:hypothetical protein [Persephonella sp.]|uniref:hypothetical protein n=1 Tax=Persephonella sp. TaxID=2060922 RepID=UPI00261343F2|nr:hypothetical protein [Persephonella sp.]
MQTATELQELIYLRTKVNELEMKIHLLEKALEFVAQRVDEEREKKNTEYLVKQILQK